MIAFHDLNIEKKSGEEMVVRIYFAEMTTFSSAAKQQSLWFNTTKEPVGLPIEKRAL